MLCLKPPALSTLLKVEPLTSEAGQTYSAAWELCLLLTWFSLAASLYNNYEALHYQSLLSIKIKHLSLDAPVFLTTKFAALHL